MPDENVLNEEMIQDAPDSTQGADDLSGEQENQPAEGGYDITQDPKYQEIMNHNRALNQKVVDLTKRMNSQNKSPYLNANQGEGGVNTGTAEYQQGLKLATADLRSGIEELLPLYPELSPEIVSQIRRNPLGFVSEDFFSGLNTKNALIDVETYMLRMAESAGAKPVQQPNPRAPQQQVRPSSAPVGQQADEEMVDPMEDWTMPLEDLEKKVAKIRSRQN